MFLYWQFIRGIPHVQAAIEDDGTRMDEIRSAYLEELDFAAEAPDPDGGGDSGSSPTSVASSVDQKPRLASAVRL